MAQIEKFQCPQNLDNCGSCSIIQKRTCLNDWDQKLGIANTSNLPEIKMRIDSENLLLATESA